MLFGYSWGNLTWIGFHRKRSAAPIDGAPASWLDAVSEGQRLFKSDGAANF
jgi:hypothetical protein